VVANPAPWRHRQRRRRRRLRKVLAPEVQRVPVYQRFGPTNWVSAPNVNWLWRILPRHRSYPMGEQLQCRAAVKPGLAEAPRQEMGPGPSPPSYWVVASFAYPRCTGCPPVGFLVATMVSGTWPVHCKRQKSNSIATASTPWTVFFFLAIFFERFYQICS
jgi:hypothetical protein